MIMIKTKELIIILLLSVFIFIINTNPILINKLIYESSSIIEKERVNGLTKDYLIKESPNFIYKFKESDINNIDMIIKTCEKDYMILSNIFGMKPNEKILIVVFDDNLLMNNTLKLPNSKKSMGLYYSNFISILSPNAWINKGDDKNDVFVNKGPILHELVHYFVDKLTNGNYPIWLTEGVALYFEKQQLGFEIKTDTFTKYKVSELENFNQLNQDSAYISSFMIVTEYVKIHGVSGLLNIIQTLGEGYSLEEFRNF